MTAFYLFHLDIGWLQIKWMTNPSRDFRVIKWYINALVNNITDEWVGSQILQRCGCKILQEIELHFITQQWHIFSNFLTRNKSACTHVCYRCIRAEMTLLIHVRDKILTQKMSDNWSYLRLCCQIRTKNWWLHPLLNISQAVEKWSKKYCVSL